MDRSKQDLSAIVLCFVFGLLIPGGVAYSQQAGPTLSDVQAKMQAAFAAQDARTPGYGDTIRQLSAALARFSAYPDAVVALNRLQTAPESPLDVAEAMRMKSKYLLASGDSQGSLQEAQAQVAYIDNQPQFKAQLPSLWARSVTQCAMTMSCNGNHAGALAMNDRLLASTVVGLPKPLLETALLNRVTYLQKLQQDALAVMAIDSLFSQIPDFGKDSGECVALKLTRERLIDPTELGDGYIAALSALWQSADYKGYPQTVEVGQSLVNALSMRVQLSSACDKAIEVIDRIDKYRDKWIANSSFVGVTSTSLDGAVGSMCSVLQSAKRLGKPDLVLFALNRFVTMATDDATRAYWKQALFDYSQSLLP